MTSKSLYIKLMREDLKRRIWTVALSFLAFFFLFPVRVAMIRPEILKKEGQGVRLVEDYMSIGNEMLVILILGMSLILGVTGFSYLHSKQKVDFYHSIPVRREKLFFANYINGILIFAFTYFVNLLLGLALAAGNGVLSGAVLASAFSAFGASLVNYLMMYSIVALSMIMTGNIIVGILGTAVFNFFGPALCVIVEGYYEVFLKTFSYHSSFLNTIVEKSSPMAVFMANVTFWNSHEQWGSRIVITLCIFAAVTVLSLFLYKKRNSESAGKAMAFAVSKPFIEIPLVILSALSGGMFFWEIRYTAGWAAFGLLCGLLMSHCVIEIIFHFDFKKLFSHKRRLGISAAAAAVIFLIFYLDLFHYDSYVPKKEQIQSVSVHFSTLDGWIEYGEPRMDGVNGWKYQNAEEYVLENMKLEDVDAVLKIVDAAIARNRELKNGTGVGDDVTADSFPSNIEIRYVLNNNKNVYRSYRLPLSQVMDELERVYQMKAFKKGVYPILSQTPQETATVNFEQRNEITNINIGSRQGTEEELAQLLAAYQEELMAQTIEQRLTETPIASIQFMTNDMWDFIQEFKKKYPDAYNNVESRCYYPVYPSFTKTLDILSGYGVMEKTDAKVERIEIEPYTQQYYYEEEGVRSSRENRDSEVIAVTDHEQIDEIMKAAVPAEYAEMNSMNSASRGIYINVFFGTGARSRYESYCIDKSRIPEFLEEKLSEFALH